MSTHLSIRVAWHDNRWNGKICNNPSANSFCLHLTRIYEEKDDEEEDAIRNKPWGELTQEQLPPCKAEGGAFMGEGKYTRLFHHPYNQPGRKDIPHLVLKPTTIEVPPYSIFSVPFWWMLKGNLEEIQDAFPDIPNDEKAPFYSSWIYGRETQVAILNKFFNPINEGHSLAVFYIKGSNPIDEDSRRLIAGVGSILKKSNVLVYETTADYTYPLWDRLITHGIRPNDAKSEGVLIPYHDYLDLPEDFVLKTKYGKKSKLDLLNEIKLTLQETGSQEEVIHEFTYGSSHIKDATMLIVLTKLRSIVERIKEHGIAKGFWDNDLIWIDKQIGKVKESMGPFPSFANALLALGFQYGNLLEEDLRTEFEMKPKDNVWEYWESVINGNINIGQKPYKSELPIFRDTWLNESVERKELIMLLSRFDLSAIQIKNWYDNAKRRYLGYKVTDEEILLNPYRISEEDESDINNYAISVEAIDNGIFIDKAIQGDFIPPILYAIDSPLDKRRIRALSVSILKKEALNGDTLLSVNEITEQLNSLSIQRQAIVPENYIASNAEFFKQKLEHIVADEVATLQLNIYKRIEDFFRKTMPARCKKELDVVNENWEELVIQTIEESGVVFNYNDPKHIAALQDQVKGLSTITSKKLTVLHGPAGTGKTTVLGALFKSKELKSEGILLLAPTGKARVKLGKMAKSIAYTIAQFLNRQDRFDWSRMKPRFGGKETYQGEQNIVIDECSMLTEDDLYALFRAIDLGYVKRIILVGDPFQLPPIGAGKPFADLCSYLELLKDGDEDIDAKSALAVLKEVVRTVDGNSSDTLMLASWFSGIKPKKNADEIFSKIGNNDLLNDLEVECWQNEVELFEKINNVLVNTLKLDDEDDYATLNKFLGYQNGKIDTKKIEAFQLLSPVKAPFWGTFNINRRIQQQFRAGFIRDAVNIGDYKIGPFDKVIQTVNEKKEGFPGNDEYQLSNGQLGMVKGMTKGYANVVFAGIEEAVTFGYKGQGQGDSERANLELAYAISVHKSQGSDFDFVFLIIPKTGRLISRELIYTALTRAKKRLILLVEGDSPHWIFNISKPQYSITAKRNTMLFVPSVRFEKGSMPFAEGLIHKTKKDGLIVRSKSEVIVANLLIERELDFEYEREFKGKNGSKRIPDFTFIDPAGDLIILEHLGMLTLPSYKFDWEKKLKFYEDNGFKLGVNLFTTEDKPNGAIDSIEIDKTLGKIQNLL